MTAPCEAVIIILVSDGSIAAADAVAIAQLILRELVLVLIVSLVTSSAVQECQYFLLLHLNLINCEPQTFLLSLILLSDVLSLTLVGRSTEKIKLEWWFLLMGMLARLRFLLCLELKLWLCGPV